MPSIQDLFEGAYLPRIKQFVEAIAGLETSGIPEPHLPHWGAEYEVAPIRLGIIGRDTRSWGNMPDFLDAVNTSPREALYRGKGEFDSYDFTDWTNNFGKTFWDTSLRILAAMHGVDDWKRLKRCEVVDPLRRFFWANVNSVERFEVSPKSNGVAWNTWHKVKAASEKNLDSFRMILDVFHPQVVFLLNWDPGDHFLDFPIDWTHFGDHQAEATDSITGCLILATAHPTWLNQNGLYDEAINGIIQRAKKAVDTTARIPSISVA